MKIIDLHCDTLLWSVMKPEDPLEDSERQITVEKLIRGGALAQCFALFVPTDGQGSMAEQKEKCYGFFRKIAENFEEAMRKHADVLLQARNAAEIRRNAAAGKI
ncbi:MAG: membrane dipeptidase, partial [Lachnospiraceae bacterium]|nr:membrane dipeptidase [Lachnospiraceae bacterium]